MQTPLALYFGAFVLLCGSLSMSARADVFDYTGHNDLVAELGGSTPDGTGVTVTLVEANTDSNLLTEDADPSNDHLPVDGEYNFRPNVTQPHYTGKTFNIHIPPDTTGSDASGHANNVARRWFSVLGESIAPGITEIDAYEANHWLDSGILSFGSGAAPIASANLSRVANHAYIGSTGNSTDDLQLLQRIDWLVDTDNFVQVAGATTAEPIHAFALNVIRAGRLISTGTHGGLTGALPGSVYTSGRLRHDVLALEGTASYATARVSSVATILIGVAKDNPGLSNGSLLDRNGQIIYHGETAEVVRALLLAGGDRDLVTETATSGAAYSVNSTNGLHTSYGAGVANIFNSYHMLAGGEHDSAEDGGPASVGLYGFDYDTAFGGAGGSNTQATYTFTAATGIDEFAASLAWHAEIDIDEVIAGNESTAATLRNLDLSLYRVTGGGDVIVANSNSTIEPTENIWLKNLAAGEYKLVVDAIGPAFEWDYGIAWRGEVSAVPTPTSGAALGLMFATLLVRRPRRR